MPKMPKKTPAKKEAKKEKKPPDLERELRQVILKFFQQPQRSFQMDARPEFENYANFDIRRIFSRLVGVGLIKNVNGKYTRAAVYQTTRDGRRLLDPESDTGAKQNETTNPD